MWSSNEEMRERKMIALADRGYLQQEEEHKNGRKFSRAAAMILGSLLTLEIMVAGAMIFNIDVHAVDGIALVLSFMVLYFGVVAVLTDK